MMLLFIPLFYLVLTIIIAHFSIVGAAVMIALGMIFGGTFAAIYS